VVSYDVKLVGKGIGYKLFNLLMSEDKTLAYSSHFYSFSCYTISCCIMRFYIVSYGFRSHIIYQIDHASYKILYFFTC
jgi:hypothetical protein